MTDSTSLPPAGLVTVDRYRPRSMARTHRTDTPYPRFPVIDAHNHFDTRMSPREVVDLMDACGVRVYADLSGWSGERLKRRLDLLKGSFPERFAVFAVPEFERASEPGFGEREARAVERAKLDGAQGVKVFKSLGLSIRDGDGALLAIDDPRFDPIWQSAGEAGLPVMIHVADPWAFFEPLDECNERYAQLIRHPDWHFHGEPYPTLESLLAARDRVVERHPKTIFIGAHVGSEVEDLDRAERLLLRCPNYRVDFSARMAELGRQPRRARRFFLDHADRILFGTDGGADADTYRAYYHFLETDDECFEPIYYPQHGFWLISALDLPEEVLLKIYYENALSVIPGLNGSTFPNAPAT